MTIEGQLPPTHEMLIEQIIERVTGLDEAIAATTIATLLCCYAEASHNHLMPGPTKVNALALLESMLLEMDRHNPNIRTLVNAFVRTPVNVDMTTPERLQ